MKAFSVFVCCLVCTAALDAASLADRRLTTSGDGSRLSALDYFRALVDPFGGQLGLSATGDEVLMAPVHTADWRAGETVEAAVARFVGRNPAYEYWFSGDDALNLVHPAGRAWLSRPLRIALHACFFGSLGDSYTVDGGGKEALNGPALALSLGYAFGRVSVEAILGLQRTINVEEYASTRPFFGGQVLFCLKRTSFSMGGWKLYPSNYHLGARVVLINAASTPDLLVTGVFAYDFGSFRFEAFIGPLLGLGFGYGF
jgi:hypothetical protein